MNALLHTLVNRQLVQGLKNPFSQSVSYSPSTHTVKLPPKPSYLMTHLMQATHKPKPGFK